LSFRNEGFFYFRPLLPPFTSAFGFSFYFFSILFLLQVFPCFPSPPVFYLFISCRPKSFLAFWEMADWTKVIEWDELILVAGVVLMLLGYFELGFWVAAAGALLFLATEGYLHF